MDNFYFLESWLKQDYCMKGLYFVKRYRKSWITYRLDFWEVKNKFLLKFIDGEIHLKGKYGVSPIEKVCDDDQGMVLKGNNCLKKGGF